MEMREWGSIDSFPSKKAKKGGKEKGSGDFNQFPNGLAPALTPVYLTKGKSLTTRGGNEGRGITHQIPYPLFQDHQHHHIR